MLIHSRRNIPARGRPTCSETAAWRATACRAAAMPASGARRFRPRAGETSAHQSIHGTPAPGRRCSSAPGRQGREGKVEPVADMVADRTRDANPARFREGLDPGGDIYAVAMNVAVL